MEKLGLVCEPILYSLSTDKINKISKLLTAALVFVDNICGVEAKQT